MRLGVCSASTGSAAATARLLGTPRGLRARLVCRSSSAAQDGDFTASGEAGRPGAGGHEVKAQAQHQQQPDGGTPPRRGPGRPPGHPAWNKGLPMAESTRKQLSYKLKQKWKDPEYRRSVTEAMGGRQAWNAGRPHDEETRAKMADAKVGKPKTLATRKRMSAAALGHPVSAEVRAEVGDRFRGQPKTAEHRNKLAAVARRRHAATRVLRAVEAVYAAASSAPAEPSAAAAAAAGAPPGGPRPVATAASAPAGGPAGPRGAAGASGSALGAGGAPPTGSGAGLGAAAPTGPAAGSRGGGGGRGSGGSNMGAVRAAAYSMGLTGLSDSKTGKRLSRTQILNTFKSELREYRALQEELSTWTAAFREKNNRKPNLVDVQRTGIPWLIERFKQYVVLRDRLFSDTSVLRNKLGEALPDPDSVRNANGGPSASSSIGSLGPTNANGTGVGGRSALANRFAAVMEYKQARAGQAAAGAAAAGAAAAATARTAGGAGTGEDFEQLEMEEPGTSAADQLAAKVMSTPQTPARVRLAMQAAMEYRQQKAKATKDAAETAAAAARNPSSGAGTSRAAAARAMGSSQPGSALPQGLAPQQPAASADVPAPVPAAVAATSVPAPVAAAETAADIGAAAAAPVQPAATASSDAADALPVGGIIAAAGALG